MLAREDALSACSFWVKIRIPTDSPTHDRLEIMLGVTLQNQMVKLYFERHIYMSLNMEKNSSWYPTKSFFLTD